MPPARVAALLIDGRPYLQACGKLTYVCPRLVSDPSPFISTALGIGAALNHE